MTPAAIIPMHTPEEAIEELEFVTKQLGSKVGMFGSGMARQVPSSPQSDPDGTRMAVWYDVLAIDSEYNYDPVWAKCRELGIAPTFHSAGSNQALRNSPSNFIYNHIGHFAAAARGVQGHLPGRRHAAVPGASLRLPRGRRAAGPPAALRPVRVLGEAQREAAGATSIPSKVDLALLVKMFERYGNET